MAKEIRNIADLQKFMMQHCKKVCELMANEVYETLNYFLDQYYSEWTPSSYSRSYDFLHSAFKTKVEQVGMGYQAVVGIDYESLDNYKDASGYEVVSYANERGIHGGYDASSQGAHTEVWNDTIETAINSGQLLKDCIIYLKGKGFKVIE